MAKDDKKQSKWKTVLKLLGLVVGSYVLMGLTRTVHHVLMLARPKIFYKDHLQDIHKLNVDCAKDISFYEVKTIYNVHNVHDAMRVINQNVYEPMLFKKFVPNSLEKWDVIEKHHRDVNISVHDIEIYGFGNIFFAGGHVQSKSIESTVYDILHSSNGPDSNKTMYGSFLTFMDPKFAEDPEHNFAASLNILRDTNFLSNFPRDLLATSIHFAPMAKSYAIQYVGTKLWLLVPPHIMEKIGIVSTPASFPLGGSEEELFSLLKGSMEVVVQEEGDLFYFPPQWGHAVVTKAGKNVMLNYREPAPGRAFVINPFRALEAIAAGILSKTNSVFSHHGTQIDYDIMRVAFAASHRKLGDEIDSNCKDIWLGLLNK